MEQFAKEGGGFSLIGYLQAEAQQVPPGGALGGFLLQIEGVRLDGLVGYSNAMIL